MHSDAAFYTGKTHAVCEDYAKANGILTAEGEILPHIIVSDGCSGSPDTDTGARLMTFAVESVLQKRFPFDAGIAQASALMSLISAQSMGLGIRSLDATALFARVVKTGSVEHSIVQIGMFGDGAIAFKSKSSDIVHLQWVEYANGMPFYPTYLAHPSDMEDWKKQSSDAQVYTSVAGGNKKDRLCCKSSEANPGAVMLSGEYFQTLILPTENLEWVALMSDGIHTFVDHDPKTKQRRTVEIEEAAARVLDFVHYKGPFVKRQMNWLNKQMIKDGWSHADDLSVAAIYFGDE